MKNKLGILKGFGKLAEELKKNPRTQEDWEREELILDEMRKKNEKLIRSMTMTWEVANQPFTI